MKYENLRPDEIEAIRANVPVAVLPWGALEWHGYHAAIGLDGLKAAAFADAVADRIDGISLPTLYCGHGTMKPQAGFGHTIEISATTLESLAHEYVAQLAEEGFLVVVIISGHGNPDHLAALERGARPAADAAGIALWILPDNAAIDDAEYPFDHAAKWETSVLWHVDPDLVDLTKVRSDLELEAQGILGVNPVDTASAELGAAAFDEIVDTISERALGLLAERTGA